MKTRNVKSIVYLSLSALLLVTVGCSDSIDPEIAAARNRLFLRESPESPQSIADAKALAETPTDVTLVGRIDAGDFDPFDKDVAAFMLSDVPTDHEQEEGHDADNCPFCKRRAANVPKCTSPWLANQICPSHTRLPNCWV